MQSSCAMNSSCVRENKVKTLARHYARFREEEHEAVSFKKPRLRSSVQYTLVHAKPAVADAAADVAAAAATAASNSDSDKDEDKYDDDDGNEWR